MRRRHARRGFTLIELMVVVVIVGVLATMAVMGLRQSRARARTAALRSDLRNMVGMQEAHFAEAGRYAATLAELRFTPTPTVTVVIASADALGWAATASDPGAGLGRCAVYMGRVPAVPEPATADGVIACR